MLTIPENGKRNKRDVWTINPSNFKGAHFATFPPKLVEPMILAGTSAKGECPKCGKAWVRVTERDDPEAQPLSRVRDTPQGTHKSIDQKYNKWLEEHPVATVGWQPQCDCNAGEPVQQTVLDPFAGSGTTLAVAQEHGRNGIGIDLNPKYVEMAQQRIAQHGVRLPFEVLE